ncbi:hypothetical protein LOK49_LG05G02003 [Camellia lanceoleosa]|uniref:Uncharacterized protein n=1 Tax=Camellia lanceoleosa TaxID=1840588 RepID=A0ACC0HK86_9ERIC|nr:hypothetical protein LOK49_LG05G02003 [Camellia lanceoleosa]
MLVGVVEEPKVQAIEDEVMVVTMGLMAKTCLLAGVSVRKLKLFSSIDVKECQNRRTLICAVNQDAEESFKKTVEVDRLIDTLRDANANEKDYEELASSVMSIVDFLVHKTNEKIESATDVLKEILKPVVDEVEEIPWPPRDPEALKLMEKEINQREQEGQLDEGFLAEVNAQLRQAKEDEDKPGLQAMLQKVLQLYASRVLSKRSYAKRASRAHKRQLPLASVQSPEQLVWVLTQSINSKFKGIENQVLKAEEFLETIIKSPEDEWNKLLINGMTVGKGEIYLDEFYAVIRKRMERTLIRAVGCTLGSQPH